MDIESLCINPDLDPRDSKTNALNDGSVARLEASISLPPEVALVGKLKGRSLTNVQPMRSTTLEP